MKKSVAPNKIAANESREILNDIRRLVQAIRVASRDSEKKHGLSAAQLFVLQKLAEEEGLSINDLAERTLTHQSSVSVVARKLEEKKLIKRLTAEGDGRKSQLWLTKKGRELSTKAPNAVQETLIQALNKLEADVRKDFASGFAAFLRLAGISGKAPLLFADDNEKKKKGKK
jgi:DNA-binding MarR family transcriptional regulator